MKKITFKDILVPAISLFLICVVVSALLATTNELTKEPIAQIAAQKQADAMESVCPDAQSFEKQEGTELEAYAAVGSEGGIVGYAISSSYKGYGGDVGIMVGFDLDGNVTGVEILSCDETPGLGANCTKTEFTDMYKQAIPESGDFTVVKDSSGGSDGKIDALTGATITSNAVTEAVNKAIDTYNSLMVMAKGGAD